MEIGSYSYKKGTNNKWTYNLMHHLMVDLNRTIALASTTCIAYIDAYELHPEDEKKSSTTKVMNAKVLQYTYDRGSF